MTPHLHDALVALPTIRRGRVLRHQSGDDVTEGLIKGHRIYRICRLAGLPERSWHCLRHSYATHAAQLGVNPWRLQAWLGHSSITQTMQYVHHAETHRRAIPAEVLEVGRGIDDPDERVLAMLGARATVDGSRNSEEGSAPGRPERLSMRSGGRQGSQAGPHHVTLALLDVEPKRTPSS